MSDEFVDPYLIPGTDCLRNKLGLTDAKLLDSAEREYVLQRARRRVPRGDFDLPHLQAIHLHLFQDVYDWAGELRTLEIAKGGHHFLFHTRIEMGMGDVHRRLQQQDYLRKLGRSAFATAAGQVIGDVNYVHPFREGNGRTQFLYLQQLAEQAGHRIDLTRLDPGGWIAASIAAHDGDYGPMQDQIAACLEP